MQHASLMSFLNGERPADELWREIKQEVEDCRAACAKGGSGRVIMTDGAEIQILRPQIVVLLSALADATLPLDAASYIADALIMSDSFVWEDKAVTEALFCLSDESAPLTKVEVEGALSRIATSR